MAGLRLLRLLIALALAGSSLGCALGPIYARRVEGQVIDKRTGAPVANALVFAVYEMVWREERYPLDTRWDKTDAEGRFAIPGRFSMTLGPPLSQTDRDFFVRVVHPEFGWFGREEAKEIGRFGYDFLFEIEPNSLRRLFKKPGEWGSLCTGLGSEGCHAMCLYAYGTTEPGDRGSVRRSSQ